MSGVGVKTAKIQRAVNRVLENLYWSESKKDWDKNGTKYKSIQHAQDTIKKYKLTNCVAVTHG